MVISEFFRNNRDFLPWKEIKFEKFEKVRVIRPKLRRDNILGENSVQYFTISREIVGSKRAGCLCRVQPVKVSVMEKKSVWTGVAVGNLLNYWPFCYIKFTSNTQSALRLRWTRENNRKTSATRYVIVLPSISSFYTQLHTRMLKSKWHCSGMI